MQRPSQDEAVQVVVCGGINRDHILVSRLPFPGETCNAQESFELSGGKGANTAVAIYRLTHKSERDRRPAVGLCDVEVRMIGAVGNDDVGEAMIQELQGNGVNTEKVFRRGKKSAVANIWVDFKTGENRQIVQPGANHLLEPEASEHIARPGSPAPKIVVAFAEVPRATLRAILSTAKTAGAEIILKNSPASWLDDKEYSNVTHLIINQSEAVTLDGKHSRADFHVTEDPEFDWHPVARSYLDKGVQYVVITLGARGAFVAYRGQGKEWGTHITFEKVKDGKRTNDTSGAGDTFIGAYVTQLIKAKYSGGHSPWSIEDTIRYACQAAAHTIKEYGCQQSIPWANDLE